MDLIPRCRWGDPGTGSIYLIHPDGTGFHRLETSLVSVGDVGGGVWSPDPVVQRLLYVTPGNSLRMIDLAAAHELIVGGGFWPIWSPDGNRISFWSDGTQVRSTADALAEVQRNVRTFPAVPGNCRDHPDLANKAFCGPATWSPDGTRLISADVVGRSAVSLLADGTGSPIVMPLGSQIEGTPLPIAAWLPIRP